MDSNTDLCLIDRIALSLHLCAACSFNISYKLKNEIGNFSINTEASHRENAETLSRFLREKHEELQTFSENLRQAFVQHPELKTEHNYSILLSDNVSNKQILPLVVTTEMLGRTFSGILTRELCNKDCTIDTVKGLLKQEGVSTEDILPHFLSSPQKPPTISNIEAFKLLLVHSSTNIDSCIFVSIINENQKTLRLLLNHSQTKITDFIFSFTTNREIIDMLSEHNKAVNDNTLVIVNVENTDDNNTSTTSAVYHLIEHSVDYSGNLQEQD